MHGHHHHRHGLFPGLLLLTLGAGLFAREFGWLPATVRLVDFWPILVVFAGLFSVLRGRSVVRVFFGLAFVGLGSALLAGNLGLLTFPAARLWPGLVVLLGLAFLVGSFRRHHGGPPHRPPGGASAAGWEGPRHGPYGAVTTEKDTLSRQVTFSGAQYRVESQAWKGGELGVTLGGVELDLRNARLEPEGAQLDVHVLMGGLDIRVPDTWQVSCDVAPMFGSAEDGTRSTQGSTNAPRLRVTGSVTLGGVNIRN